MLKKRTIRSLAKQGRRVYVFTESEGLCREFLAIAEHEGFIFSDGVKPTEKHSSDVFAINSDNTISYVGIIGRMSIGSNLKETGGIEIMKVDYKRYISGDEYFYWNS